jgi:hypothetical protein
VVLNKVETSPIAELSHDLVSIITCFSSRIYGLRSHKNKKAIYEAINVTETASQTVDGGVQMDVQPNDQHDEAVL